MKRRSSRRRSSASSFDEPTDALTREIAAMYSSMTRESQQSLIMASPSSQRMPKSWNVGQPATEPRRGPKTPTPRSPLDLSPPSIIDLVHDWDPNAGAAPRGRRASVTKLQRRTSGTVRARSAYRSRSALQAGANGTMELERRAVESERERVDSEKRRMEEEKRKLEEEKRQIQAEREALELERKRQEMETEKRKMEADRERILAERRRLEAEREAWEHAKQQEELERNQQTNNTSLAEARKALMHFHEHGTGLSIGTVGSSVSRAQEGSVVSTVASSSSKKQQNFVGASEAVGIEEKPGIVEHRMARPSNASARGSTTTVEKTHLTQSAAEMVHAYLDRVEHMDEDVEGFLGVVDNHHNHHHQKLSSHPKHAEEKEDEHIGKSIAESSGTVLLRHPKTKAAVPVPASLLRDPDQARTVLASASALQLVKAQEAAEIKAGVHPRLARLRVSGWIYSTFGPNEPLKPKGRKKARGRNRSPRLSKAEQRDLTAHPERQWAPEAAKALKGKPSPELDEYLSFLHHRSGSDSKSGLDGRHSPRRRVLPPPRSPRSPRKHSDDLSSEEEEEEEGENSFRVRDTEGGEGDGRSSSIDMRPLGEQSVESSSLGRLPNGGGDPTYFERRNSGSRRTGRNSDTSDGLAWLERRRVNVPKAAEVVSDLRKASDKSINVTDNEENHHDRRSTASTSKSDEEEEALADLEKSLAGDDDNFEGGNHQKEDEYFEGGNHQKKVLDLEGVSDQKTRDLEVGSHQNTYSDTDQKALDLEALNDMGVGRLGEVHFAGEEKDLKDLEDEEQEDVKGEVVLDGEHERRARESVAAAAMQLAMFDEEDEDEADEGATLAQELAATEMQRLARGWFARRERARLAGRRVALEGLAVRRLMRLLRQPVREKKARNRLSRFFRKVRFAKFLTPRKAAMRVQKNYRGHLGRREVSARKDLEAFSLRGASVVPSASAAEKDMGVLPPEIRRWVEQRCAALTDEEVRRVASLPAPPPALDGVAAALCVLLELGDSAKWSHASRAMGEPGFARNLALVHPSSVDPVSRLVARRLLRAQPNARFLLREAVRGEPYARGESSENRTRILSLSAALSKGDHSLLTPPFPDPPQSASPAVVALTLLDAAISMCFYDHDEPPPRNPRDSTIAVRRDETPLEDDTTPSEAPTSQNTAPTSQNTAATSQKPLSAADPSAPRLLSKESFVDDVHAVLMKSTAPEDDAPPDEAFASLETVDVGGLESALEATLGGAAASSSATGLPQTPSARACRRAVLTAACILVGERPDAAHIRALMPSIRERMSALSSGVPVRARSAALSLLGSRRLLSLSERKRFELGDALTTLLRVCIVLLTENSLPARAAALPRSARKSAHRFYETEAEHAHASLSAQRAAMAFSDRESPAQMAMRAFFRSCYARATNRLRRWQEAGVMDLLASNPLGFARRGLLDLTKPQIASFRKAKPVPSTHVVLAGALCVVLGAKPSWKYTKKILAEASAIEYLVELEPKQADPEAITIADQILQDSSAGGGDQLLQDLRKARERAPLRFYQWLTVFIREAKDINF